MTPAWSGNEDPTEIEVAESSSAEAEEVDVFRETITVEGSPIVEGSTIDPLASLVTTVGKQQIEDLHAQDLTSALRRVPGVVISRYNPIGAFGGGDGGAFFIRGHGSGRPGAEIVMMTDGIPRFVGIWSHPLIDVASLDTTRRIDVYRSAQPVFVGNMAFGAVDMTSARRLAAGAGGRVTATVGTYDTLIGGFEYGGRNEKADYYLTAGHRRSDGHRNNADGEVTTASGRLGLRLSEAWDLSLFYEHTSSSVNDPGAIGSPSPPIVPNYDIGNDFLLTTLSHSHGAWNGTVKLYVDDGTFDWQQWSPTEQHAFRSITDSRNYGLRWRERVSPWRGAEITFGFDHDVYGGGFVERHPTDDRLVNDVELTNSAPYLMLCHTFGDQVTVTPSVGVRYNDSNTFGGEWGAQAGLTIGLSDHLLYANYAHGFNLPGLYAAVQYSGWGRGDEWRDLEAETLDHVELGWLAPLGRSTRLTASIYRDKVENAIRFVPPPPPPPLYANVGAYTVDGLEVSLHVEPADNLALFVGGTFSDADPETVPNLPQTTAVGGAAWTGSGGWRANLDLQWVDDRYVLNPRFASGQAMVEAYFLANAKLSLPWRLLGLEIDGSVFIFGENLGDASYEHRIGYPMPGRMIQLGFEVGL